MNRSTCLIALLIPAAGCFSVQAGPPADHPLLAEGSAYDAAGWDRSRQQAEAAVAPHLTEGFVAVGDAMRLEGQGFIRHETEAPSAGCYVMGLGWASSEPVRAQVLFPGTTGTRVSDVTGGTITFDFKDGKGTIPFCIDRPGKVVISIYPLDTATGAILSRYRAQYMATLATRPETAEQTAARHGQEQQGVARTAAREQANIEAAERKEQERQGRCVTERDKCVSGLPHSRPLSARPNDTCERVMQLCLSGQP